MNLATAYFPPEASTFAEGTDSVFMFITWVSIFFFALIVGLMAIFVVKYKRKSEDDVTPNISHNLLLEIVWSIIPILLVMVMFYVGYKQYDKMTDPQAAIEESTDGKVLDLYVTGKQWSWDIAYPNGTIINSKLSLAEGSLNQPANIDIVKEKLRYVVLPVDSVVRMHMTSNDVIHSFGVPAFRVKKDVIRNRNSMVWFKTNKIGNYIYTCNEMCGKEHSAMIGYLSVVSKEDYAAWVKATSVDNRSPWKLGKDTYKATCAACHSTKEGVKLVGPTWFGLYGKKNHAYKGGEVAEVDFNFIKESANKPNAKIAVGFATGSMPPQSLSDKQIRGIIEFMKSPDKDPTQSEGK
ncbi:MAG: cytochrome c oxidase subunit II [Lentisphaeraceae bacterium]|nr:cytochrome c oxidase subunit II [Lentisphaeraceae bacterium]